MNFRKTSTQLVFVALIPTLLLAGSWAWAQQDIQTEIKRGRVLYVEGNNLVVRDPSGLVQHYTVPEGFRFNVGGREVSVSQLKPGTDLTATITTITKPKTVRTTQVTRGTVWEVVGNTVMVTLESGERKTFVVPNWFKFNVAGQEKSVQELRKGMKLTATVVHETQEMVSETTRAVTGLSPAPPRPAPRPVARTVAPPRAPAPRPMARAPQQLAVSLPATGSSVPLIGLLGVLALLAAFGLRMVRVFLS